MKNRRNHILAKNSWFWTRFGYEIGEIRSTRANVSQNRYDGFIQSLSGKIVGVRKLKTKLKATGPFPLRQTGFIGMEERRTLLFSQ